MYRGFFTLMEREIYRFARLSKQTIAPPIITTLLFIFIFGYSLGGRIREIEGLSYILFIFPGLTSMGVLANAYANTSTSLFMSRMDKSVENYLTSPVSYVQMVSALALGGLLRGFIIGVITLAVGFFAIDLRIHHAGLTLLLLFLSAFSFSNLGILSALLAESWDHITTFNNFLITPLVYLGGVFYSINLLPPFWKKISLANPIFYLVDSFRYAVLGTSAVPIALSAGMLVGVSILSFSLCVFLFKKGYKLRS